MRAATALRRGATLFGITSLRGRVLPGYTAPDWGKPQPQPQLEISRRVGGRARRSHRPRVCRYAPLMAPQGQRQGMLERLSRQGEEALGKVVEEILANPVLSAAVSRALEAREKAAQAQEVAMGALNLPSAADIERLTRRVRAVSQRLEGIEDLLDRIDERLASIEQRLGESAGSQRAQRASQSKGGARSRRASTSRPATGTGGAGGESASSS